MNTYQQLYQRLSHLYEKGEAQAIVRLLLDMRFDLSLADIYAGKVTELSPNDTIELEKMMGRLEAGEPVQYVLGQASFHGYIYKVCPGVLIPRPETAELVDWIAEDRRPDLSVLDIGTGSGCIAVTLTLLLPQAKVTAWDISPVALQVAAENAQKYDADVTVVKQDTLQALADGRQWDVIVSNPPYIAEQERAAMDRNVLDYEPSLALFVADDDPLLFYRAIARYAIKSLKNDGELFFEINPRYINELQSLLADIGFTAVEVRNDQYGKQRMIKASCKR
jgi:release factor glutamine methyltransferase